MRVLVTQRWGACGVLLVPRSQLAVLRGDSYREATAAEVAAWYRVRGLVPPAVVRDQGQARLLEAPVGFGVGDAGPGGRRNSGASRAP